MMEVQEKEIWFFSKYFSLLYLFTKASFSLLYSDFSCVCLILASSTSVHTHISC